jgi:hypothetical protein
VHAVQIDVDHPVPLVGGQLEVGDRRADPGDVGERRQWRQCGLELVDRRTNVAFVRHVDHDCVRLDVVLLGELGRQGTAAVLVDVEDPDAPSPFGEQDRCRPSDSARRRCTGDDRGAVHFAAP